MAGPAWRISYSAIRVQDVSWDATSEVAKNALEGLVEVAAKDWLMPHSFVEFYHSFVPESVYERNRNSWYFPCAAKLPDITITIDGKNIIVPGSNLKSKQLKPTTLCESNLIAVARDNNTSVFGGAFMQHLYIIFGQFDGYAPVVGVAQSHPP